jgi:uncharacterized protein (DUF4415 family)
MKKEYDFSKGVRGKFYKPNKVQKTLRIDSDVLDFFKIQADKKKVGYQTLINQILRESMEHPSGLIDVKELRKELRSVIRTEMRHNQST